MKISTLTQLLLLLFSISSYGESELGHLKGNSLDATLYHREISIYHLLDTVPTKPSLLSLTVVSSSSIDLVWRDNSNNETGFKIERSLTQGNGFVSIDTTDLNYTSYSDEGLLPSTTYYYRVSAINDKGTSGYTNEVVGTTVIGSPTAPSGFNVTAASSTSFNLSWTDASNNETGFQIERSLKAGIGFTLITTRAANVTSHLDEGLKVNTTYYYRIRAINAGGNSNYTPEVSVISTISIPAKPSNLKSNISSSAINLNWTDASNNETSFQIERSSTQGSGYGLIQSTDPNVTSYSDINVTAGITYYYRIRASNGSGNSEYTNEVNETIVRDGVTQMCKNVYCDNGGIGIGTQVVPSGYKMSVKGKIMAEGVKVALQADWPDYVFQKDYYLTDIPTLKKYIKENGHLPNIPSDETVKKEGIDVEEINILLLQKIEEMSLYLIQMEERMNKLEAENRKLITESDNKGYRSKMSRRKAVKNP